MGINFRLRDFAHPISILKLKRTFARHEFSPLEVLEAYQRRRLHEVVLPAAQKLPFYARLFSERGIDPRRMQPFEFLESLPLLEKKQMDELYAAACAAGALARSQLVSTSGSRGASQQLLMDAGANVLEFTYYWRAWGWAGYRLGSPFAELSAEAFMDAPGREGTSLLRYDRLTGRLLLNSLHLSRRTAHKYVQAMRSRKVRYLKGLPSNLHAFALLSMHANAEFPQLKGVFSQGELLQPGVRKTIERAYAAPVFDSYGQMERVAAISQCPAGSYHIHSDYGFVELIESAALDSGEKVAEIVATSLHNCAMPLLRYKTGDLAVLAVNRQPCSCGRTLPVVERLIGRECDCIVTPDRRALTALYTIFDDIADLDMAQIHQHSVEGLEIRYWCSAKEAEIVSARIKEKIQNIVGPKMKIDMVQMRIDDIEKRPPGKFKAVTSSVPIEELL